MGSGQGGGVATGLIYSRARWPLFVVSWSRGPRPVCTLAGCNYALVFVWVGLWGDLVNAQESALLPTVVIGTLLACAIALVPRGKIW